MLCGAPGASGAEEKEVDARGVGEDTPPAEPRADAGAASPPAATTRADGRVSAWTLAAGAHGAARA
jgi:hypothetical protein